MVKINLDCVKSNSKSLPQEMITGKRKITIKDERQG